MAKVILSILVKADKTIITYEDGSFDTVSNAFVVVQDGYINKG